MEIWQFTEQSYHPAWEKANGPTKISIPNRLCDPMEAHRLYSRYLDEWLLGDELGFNIMVNEHHASANCMSASATLTLSILARQTKKARLLTLGIPIANRPDPVRIAEELSMVDVISGGRLEMGLIKASPFELAMSNQNPASITARFWEAHNLIIDAMTIDHPFSWEGEYFQYRNVNVWPRPIQQPTPPIWMSGAGASTARQAARFGWRLGVPVNGSGAKLVFDAYRDEYFKTHGRPAPPDRVGFLGMMVAGHTERQAHDRAEAMRIYLRYAGTGVARYENPPGYETVDANVKALRAAKKGKVAYGNPTFLDGRPLPADPSVEDLAAAGVMFAGTPDQLVRQVTAFNEGVGGIDHFLMFGQAGYMSHEDTVDSLTLIGKEVYPRLKELKAPETQVYSMSA